jgi:hypothetical protein
VSPRLGATSRKMPDPAVLQTGNAEVLTGRLAEYGELLDVLAERPGLTVISADPWSGTSDLLAPAIAELPGARVSVDARACADSLDLAMAIADTAVTQLAPDAAAWWMRTAPPASAAGLRLSRALSERGVDLDDLRLGSGLGEERLQEAIDLLVALAEGDAILAIDHLGLMLSALPAQKARELLGELRAARQRHPGLDLVLVEHPDGPASAALADSGHPLYRAGQLVRFRRPRPARFVEDLAITRPWTDARVELIGAAAELAGGVPALTWRVIELAPPEGEDAPTRALAGWRRLRRMTTAQTARQWDLLRRVHPIAQPVVAAMSVGLRPHAVAANSKSINDALSRLRQLGLAWQPEERRWALGDPLLASWVRDHAPPWAARRRP